MDEESPVLKSVADQMRCAVFLNKVGQVFVVHDQEVPTPVQWVEYDDMDQSFNIIHRHGRLQGVGLDVKKDLRHALLHSREILLVYMKDKQVHSGQKALLIVRDY